jgi:hypothetical protein
MTQKQGEAEFLARIQQTLEAAEQGLDGATCTRLRALRREAVRSRDHARRAAWFAPLAGVASVAAIAVLALSLLHGMPEQPAAMPLDDLALLSSSPEPEFYEELEFYEWLADEPQAG